MDLHGQFLDVRVAEWLRDGQQRESVPMLGYLFYVGNPHATDILYHREPNAADRWERVRREEPMTPDAVLRLTDVAQTRYGGQGLEPQGQDAGRRRGG